MNKLIPKRAKPTEHLGEQDCISLASQGSDDLRTVESVLQDYLSSAARLTGYPRSAASSIKLQEPVPKHPMWVQLNYDPALAG